nr:hypothetical protein [Candidatus Sigynarchaeum springense]
MANAAPLESRTALDRAISMSRVMLTGGIGRLIFDAFTEMDFILLNKTIMTWTIIAGIIIPIAAWILLSIAKANQDKNEKLARGLAVPVLFMMVGGVLAAVLGMSYFPGYSYTIFDTLVKDLIRLARNGMDYFMDILDDMFVLIVLVIAAQNISLIGNFISAASKLRTGASTQPQGLNVESYQAQPAQFAPQPSVLPPGQQPNAQPQPYTQPWMDTRYRSNVERPSEPYAQPLPAQPIQASIVAAKQVFPRFCRYCGAKLPDQAYFCGDCGRQLVVIETTLAVGSPAKSEHEEPASPEQVNIPMQPAATPPAGSLVIPPASTRPTNTEPGAVPPLAVMIPVPSSPLAVSPKESSTQSSITSQITTLPSPGGAEVPLPGGTTTPASVGTPPANQAETRATVDWTQVWEKIKAFFRQFTRWDTTKAFFRWLGSQIEQGFGWAYQKVFKKVPTQKTTWYCIGLIAVIIGAFIILGVALTPGPFLNGTWRTAFATTFHVQTDFRTGFMQYEGSQQRTMTWTITRTFNPSIVNVEVSFTVTSSSLNPGSGYVPDVSPMTLEGRISGTRLTLVDKASMFQDERVVGEFSFTSASIMGTWNDSWCLAYCQAVYTSVNGLSLVR